MYSRVGIFYKGSVNFIKGRYKGRYIFPLDLYELYEYIVKTKGKKRKVPTLPTLLKTWKK